MEDVIDDLRAALDQMNRKLTAIEENTRASKEYLQEIKNQRPAVSENTDD